MVRRMKAPKQVDQGAGSTLQCAHCQAYKPGETMGWMNGVGWIHVSCAPAAEQKWRDGHGARQGKRFGKFIHPEDQAD